MEIKTNYISKFFFSKNDTVPVGHMVDELMGICCSFRLDKAEWVNNLEGEKPYEDLEFTYSAFIARFRNFVANRKFKSFEFKIPKRKCRLYLFVLGIRKFIP